MKKTFGILILIAGLTGCGTFKKKISVFEREILAKKSMALNGYPLEEIGKQHMINAREGSMGGFGGGGGGCGCN